MPHAPAAWEVKNLEKVQISLVKNLEKVQLFPKARAAIKYLVKDNRYDYIETGSLVSIKKNVKDIQIPSEERHIKMNPMDSRLSLHFHRPMILRKLTA